MFPLAVMCPAIIPPLNVWVSSVALSPKIFEPLEYIIDDDTIEDVKWVIVALLMVAVVTFKSLMITLSTLASTFNTSDTFWPCTWKSISSFSWFICKGYSSSH